MVITSFKMMGRDMVGWMLVGKREESRKKGETEERKKEEIES